MSRILERGEGGGRELRKLGLRWAEMKRKKGQVGRNGGSMRIYGRKGKQKGTRNVAAPQHQIIGSATDIARCFTAKFS